VKARLAGSAGVRVVAEVFVDAGALLTLSVPEAVFSETARMLSDATSGRVILAVQQ